MCCDNDDRLMLFCGAFDGRFVGTERCLTCGLVDVSRRRLLLLPASLFDRSMLSAVSCCGGDSTCTVEARLVIPSRPQSGSSTRPV